MTTKIVINDDNFVLLTNNPNSNNSITGMISSDLLSHVMANGEEGNAFITVINNINTLGVASLLDFSCIIFTHNIKVNPDIIKKANSLNIPVISTTLTTTETIIYLYKLGI